MRVRADFVSNSSSSSFIVKKDGDVPKIFVDGASLLDFDSFAESVVQPAVFEPFYDVMYGYSWSKKDEISREDVVLMPDAEFAKAFAERRLDDFALPESCAELAGELCDHIMALHRIEDERVPPLYDKGKVSKELTEVWRADRGKRGDVERDKAEEAIKSMLGKITATLRPLMGGWEFYRVELGDEDGSEQTGYNLVQSGAVRWYWTFCNH